MNDVLSNNKAKEIKNAIFRGLGVKAGDISIADDTIIVDLAPFPEILYSIGKGFSGHEISEKLKAELKPLLDKHL